MDFGNLMPSLNFEDRTGANPGEAILGEVLMNAGLIKPAKKVRTQSPIPRQSKPILKAENRAGKVQWDKLYDVMVGSPKDSGLTPEEMEVITKWMKRKESK